MLKTAYKFMIYDKPKTLGALLGVVIANFLIGQQTGIFLFLTGAMSSLVTNTQTDMWVVDAKANNVNAMPFIDIRLGNELESIKGIEKVYPYIISGGSSRFESGKNAGVLLIGSQSPTFMGGPWNIIAGSQNSLLEEGAVTVDFFDRKALGNPNMGEQFEINGKKVFVAGQTKGARGFGAIYMFTTIERARALTKASRNKASAFLLKLDKGTSPELIRDMINANIPGVRAWLPKDFAWATVVEILSSSGIAISTGTLIVFAVICGMVIIGLTLYSAAVDRIKDYATLKAIGAGNGYISRLIYIQAIVIALIGFVLGQFLVEGFRNGVGSQGAIFTITPILRTVFFLTTIVISLGGAYFAVRRISQAEPASVFRA